MAHKFVGASMTCVNCGLTDVAIAMGNLPCEPPNPKLTPPEPQPLPSRKSVSRRANGDDSMAKQSLYFPEEMLGEITHESARQDRSLSWLVQQAWRIAKARIQSFPAPANVTKP